MAATNTIARTLHDSGLAAWFGGSLMGAVGVNGAAAQVDDPRERVRVANAGWGRWTPVNAAAIGAHLLGATLLTTANKGRIAGQRGVATSSAIKTALTAGALGATAYARVLGQKVMNADGVAAQGATDPSVTTPPDVASAQKKLRMLQWVLPGLTGALVAMTAYMGEQQRPKKVASGVWGRLVRS